MTEHVTVEAVKDARDWQSDDGKIKLTFYTLDVKRESGMTQEVDHSRKQGGREPEPGEELDVIFEEGKYRPKMKKAPQGSFGGGSSERSTGSPKGNWQPESERDPERAARILRQHSQEMAVRMCIANGTADGEHGDRIQGYLKAWADFFDQDVNAAGKAASQGAGASAISPAQASSPATTPAPEKPPAEDIADIEMALNETPSGSFMGAEARSLVAEYMQTQLAADDLTRACNQLTNKGDQEQQEMTFRAMCKRTEKWKGQPLPSGVSDKADGSDIPFRRPEYREMFSERERWRF